MKRPRNMVQIALFVASALLFPCAVDAAGGSRLVYGRAPGIAGCPDESELRAAVRARLGYDPFFPWAEQTIVVHIAPRPNRRLNGKVYLVDSLGRASPEREFTTTADECNELVLTLALAIVITLDPLHGTTAPKTQSAPPALSPTAATPTSATSSTPTSGESRGEGPAVRGANGSGEIAASPRPGTINAKNETVSPHTNGSAVSLAPPRVGEVSDAGAVTTGKTAERAFARLDAGGGAIATAGTMPGISAGFAPFLRARHGEGSIAAEGRYEVSALNWVNGDKVNVSLLGGSIVPCFHFGSLTGCAAFLLGRYRARGLDVAPKEAAALFAAAGVRVGAEIPMGSGAWAFVRGEGSVNLTRHELATSEELLWRVPALGFTLSVGAFASIL